MDYEQELSFVYNTISAYSKFEEYTSQKLMGKYPNEKKYDGYLIDKKYLDFWKKYVDYDRLKQVVQCNNYKEARPNIYKYRHTNRLRNYQEDCKQELFQSPEELYESVRLDKKSYALIDHGFWKLVCSEEGLKEKGYLKFSLENTKMKIFFGEFDYAEIITKDNIIDESKEIILSGADVVRDEDLDETEVKKLILLYSFEQELKNKLKSPSGNRGEFKEYYLISKDWINGFKAFYHYNEIVKMIENNKKLNRLLLSGFEETKKNITLVMKDIMIKHKVGLPEELMDNNTFLVERGEQPIDKNTKVSYWKNFEIVNEELKDLFSSSKLHQYGFTDSSFANILIRGGKLIINLANDEYNYNEYALEICSLNEKDYSIEDEIILHYENYEALNQDMYFIQSDFVKYQKEYLIFGKNLECDLLSNQGKVYGKGIKLPKSFFG